MMLFPNIPHRTDEPLSAYTSYRIGGPAKIFTLPETKEHLFAIGEYLKQTGTPYFILGNGSNVLAPDEGFPGVVICTRNLSPFLEINGTKVRASAGTLNARLLRACAEKGLGGLDALSGVPGNLGGAIFMNAGTAAGWIDEPLFEVEVLDLHGGERVISKENLKYSYREQHYLRDGEFIWAATLALKNEEPDAIRARLGEAIKKRKAAQPIEMPSCGSVFRNPEGKNAWQLIADAGLKGLSQGRARFSAKHCNFIVNEGGATRADVLFLIELAKRRVKEECAVELQQEVLLLEPRYL